jgi:hypothetical protein
MTWGGAGGRVPCYTLQPADEPNAPGVIFQRSGFFREPLGNPCIAEKRGYFPPKNSVGRVNSPLSAIAPPGQR